MKLWERLGASPLLELGELLGRDVDSLDLSDYDSDSSVSDSNSDSTFQNSSDFDSDSTQNLKKLNYNFLSFIFGIFLL